MDYRVFQHYFLKIDYNVLKFIAWSNIATLFEIIHWNPLKFNGLSSTSTLFLNNVLKFMKNKKKMWNNAL
jgi:hypothetical protein